MIKEKQFKIESCETVFSGFLKLERYRLRHTSFLGGWCEPVTRERLEGLRAVAVLPYDPRSDSLVLVEQFRVGPLDTPEQAWVLDVIGGYWEPGERAEDVARRECLEEAGCEVLDLVRIGEFLVSPGISSERVALFCARVDAPLSGSVHGLAHEGEQTRVEVVSLEEADAALFGRINATTALITIQWLLRHRNEVRRRWGLT
jgi:ADP-ribose pyrophosphatase